MSAKVSGHLAKRLENAKHVSQNSALRKTLEQVPGIEKLIRVMPAGDAAPSKSKKKKSVKI